MNVAFRGPIAGLSGSDRARLMTRARWDQAGNQAGRDAEVRSATARILEEVREEGDASLLRMAERFDGVSLESLEVPRERWGDAARSLDPAVREALERAAANIETFHRALVPDEVRVETEPGVTLGRRFVPLDTVGVYAPGGRAAYPSSVLMGVVPARAVGCPEIVVCSPPGPEGDPPAEVLAAAAIGGATRLFAVGGAGAVGAMAFGTESIPRCDAVVGPGNRWVIEAKRQVAGRVVIDSPAGPSEVLVLAEWGDAADVLAEQAAAELLAQAEHDPDAAVVLVTTSVDLLERVEAELELQLDRAPRAEIARAALQARGALLLARDRDEALDFAREWGAEHLAILTPDPAADLERVPTAGTAFLGASSSVAFGDYMTGANHVLPTAGASRSFSGLSTLNFMRSYTWQEITPAGAASMADSVVALAEAEGLPGHAAAARSAARSADSPPGSGR